MSDGPGAKERIMETVVSLLREGKDFSHITNRQIAEMANVNSALINYYYQSKENLLNAAVDVCMGNVFEELIVNEDKNIPPTVRLKGMVKAIADIAFSNYSISEIALTSEMKRGGIDTLKLLLPLLKEMYGDKKSEMELKLIACQIVVPMQTIFLNVEDYEKFLKCDIWDKQTRYDFLDKMIDNILSFKNERITMDINTFMEQGITSITEIASKFYLKQASGRRFISKFVPAVKKSAGIRNRYERTGNHIPPFLIASIATQCNLHCSGCYARADDRCGNTACNDEMTSEQWKHIFEQALNLGISFILLAGGEPMMRKDILETAAKFPQIAFPVFTNGTLMDEKYTAFFDVNRNLIPILSIEGDEAATDARRGEGVFTQIRTAAKRMAQKRILFGASITVTSENMKLVTNSKFVHELKNNGCVVLFYVEYVPVQSGSEDLVVSEAEREVMEARIQVLKERYQDLIVISFPGDEKHMGGCLAAGRGFFHINAAGGAEPCPFSPYSDVNVKDYTLLEALKSPLFKRLHEEGILAQEHKGGCVLFEKKSAVHMLAAAGNQRGE